MVGIARLCIDGLGVGVKDPVGTQPAAGFLVSHGCQPLCHKVPSLSPFPVCLGTQLPCQHKFVFAAVDTHTHTSDHKCKLDFLTKVEMVMSLAACRKEKGPSHMDWGAEAHPERLLPLACEEESSTCARGPLSPSIS